MTGRVESLARLAVVVTAAVIGLSTVHLVREQPAFALVVPGSAGLLTLLAPGAALVVVGVVGWRRGQEVRCAQLLVVAGTSWFLLEWNTPAVPSSPVFTAALVGYAVLPPLVAHAALAYPTGRTGTVFLAVGYAVALLGIGLLPALLTDPAGAGCQACPRDLLAVADQPDAALRVTQLSLAAGALWSLAAAAVLVRRVAVAVPAMRRARAGVSSAAAAFLVLTASAQLWQLATDSLAVDATLRRLHVGQALALVALAAAVAWGWTRRARTRARVARLVLDLAATPPPGGLRDSLARGLGDETLRLGYWLTDGRLVDVAGQPLEVADGSATPLVEGGRPVALLAHRPGLLDDLRVADEVAAAARLALENERLHAELAAQLTHLRASRQRIVTAADAARRQLERDLHDGAQQQLVGLLLRLRLDRARWPADVAPATVELAARVERALQGAVEELRDLARGIFPSVLVDEGLAPAVEDFAETAPVPVTVGRLPDQRLPQPVESAGYFVVAEAVRRSGAPGASVEAAVAGDRLRVAVGLTDVATADGWLTPLEDRVGASDGTVAVVPTPGGLRVEAVIPCAS